MMSIMKLARAVLALFTIRMAEEGGTGATGNGAAPDWRALIAGEDPAALASLKDIEDPKVLLASHTNTIKWRENIAGDNPDALKTLERFASPKALYDSYSELRGRVSKGELKAVQAFPDNGTPEQQAQWRTENGVPADGKYEFKLPDGVQIGELDKPVIENFTKMAHAKNLPAGAVNEVVGWYLQDRTARAEAAKTEFENTKRDVAATLGSEWGVEYKPNLNRIQGMIDATIPAEQKELKDLINNALATNAHFARHYAAIALQINPAGTLVPGDRGANEASVSDEIKKIEAKMKTDRRAYDKDEALQQRYRDLLDGYGRLTGKNWGQS